MRSEHIVDTGLEYVPGDHVLVRVVKRDGRTSVSDAGAAVARAGRPPGWRDVAQRIDDELVVNVSRQGIVFLPAEGRRGLPEQDVVTRIGEASLALYQDLLELT